MTEYIIDLYSEEDRAEVKRVGFDSCTVNGYRIKAEVVRCRDCKMYHPKEGQMLRCRFEYKDFTQWRSAEPDGYCAWGERAVD